MNYWSSFIVSSVLGFAAGYATCLIVTRLTHNGAKMPDRWRTFLGIVLLLLSVATFIQAYRSIDCIRQGIVERADANGRESRAQIVLLEATINDDMGDDRAAILEYLQAARDLEQARLDNPLRCS